jgi:hypothetical protein
MTNQYDVGALVRCSGVFTNRSGTAVDPTVVGFKVKNPSGTVTTYTYGSGAQVVRDSAGHYHVDVDANAPGQWHYRFYSTGTGQAASEGVFDVDDSAFV